MARIQKWWWLLASVFVVFGALVAALGGGTELLLAHGVIHASLSASTLPSDEPVPFWG
jgi:hypothetical protein